jgi:hypothetical protein
MFTKICVKNLRKYKKMMGNMCDYDFGNFYFLKKVKLAFNDYPSIDDGNAFKFWLQLFISFFANYFSNLVPHMDLFTNQLFQFVFSLGADFNVFLHKLKILHEMNVQDTYTNTCLFNKIHGFDYKNWYQKIPIFFIVCQLMIKFISTHVFFFTNQLFQFLFSRIHIFKWFS